MRRPNRFIVVLALLLFGAFLATAMALIFQTYTTAKANARALVAINHNGDLTTTTSAESVADLRRSIDCVALLGAGQQPPACDDVAARLSTLGAGGNPFARP